MSKPTEVVIGDTRFYITPLDPFVQLRLFGDLQREILPSVGGLLNHVLGKSGEADASADAAGIAALRELSTRFDGAALERWAGLLLDAEYVAFETNDMREPAKLRKSEHRRAFPDMTYILELMFHVGKVNFAAPLARWASLTGLAQKLTERLRSESSDPTSLTSS